MLKKNTNNEVSNSKPLESVDTLIGVNTLIYIYTFLTLVQIIFSRTPDSSTSCITNSPIKYENVINHHTELGSEPIIVDATLQLK